MGAGGLLSLAMLGVEFADDGLVPGDDFEEGEGEGAADAGGGVTGALHDGDDVLGGFVGVEEDFIDAFGDGGLEGGGVLVSRREAADSAGGSFERVEEVVCAGEAAVVGLCLCLCLRLELEGVDAG